MNVCMYLFQAPGCDLNLFLEDIGKKPSSQMHKQTIQGKQWYKTYCMLLHIEISQIELVLAFIKAFLFWFRLVLKSTF